MIKFERYPHINDLLSHYAESLNNQRAEHILENGVSNKQEAKEFSVSKLATVLTAFFMYIL